MTHEATFDTKSILFVRSPKLAQMRDPLDTSWNRALSGDRTCADGNVPFPGDAGINLAQLVDFSQMNEIFADYLEVVGLPVAIIDFQGHVLASSKWQRVCMEFHRTHNVALTRCLESDTALSRQMQDGKGYAMYRCRNGLTDCASPIIIEGQHIANLFIGQFFLAPPNLAEFEYQCVEFGFDRDAYFQALTEVPIVEEEKVPAILNLLVGLSQQIARQSLAEHRLKIAYAEVEKQVRERTRELTDSERKYRMLTENMKDVVWTLDTETMRFLYVSPSVTKLRGFTPEEIVAAPLDAALMTPEAAGYLKELNRQRVGQFLSGAVSPAHFYTDEVEQPCKDGTTVWTEINSYYYLNQETGHVELQGVSRDITERKQSERLLRESEARFKAVADSSPLAIYMSKEKGDGHEAVYVNPAFVNLFGYTLDDVPTAAHWYTLAYPDASYREQLVKEWLRRVNHAVATQSSIEPMEAIATCKDGSLKHVLWGLNSFGQINWAFGLDLTERRQAEAKLIRATEAAEAANRAKSEFLANMSHEIRTPMTAVLGLAQLLENEPLSSDQRDMVQRIRAAGRTLLSILNDILDFSKIEAGQLRIEAQPFTLMPLLQHLEVLQGNVARDKGLVFSIEPTAEPSGNLMGDPLRLEQIFLNLIGNAIKFTEQGEVLIRVLPVEITASLARIRFEVRDTGVGIPPEVLVNLFEPFTQADGSITRRFGGTGLGLTISKRLIELAGGTIGVESAVGVGSTFWFEIPFERTSAIASAPATASVATTPGFRLQGRRVLVVDDSDINRDLVFRVLVREGAVPVLASDGQQALDALRGGREKFDAVLMDVQMPVMDGITAIRTIRNELGLTDLPVIAFTAGVFHEERQAALDAGADDFLSKPVDLEEMIFALLRWTAPSLAGACSLPSESSSTPPQSLPSCPEGIPPIPGIDTRRTAVTFGDDRKFFLELMGTFFSRFSDAAERVRDDLTRGDRDAATRRLHTLRGTAGNLGALELMESAGALQQALVDGHPDAEPLLRQMDMQLANLKACILPLLPESGNSLAVTFMAPPLDPDRLESLRSALARSDMNSLDLFDKMQRTLVGAYGEEKTRAMADALKQLHFGEMLRLLDGGGEECSG